LLTVGLTVSKKVGQTAAQKVARMVDQTVVLLGWK
jgi:hypothetical protein